MTNENTADTPCMLAVKRLLELLPPDAEPLLDALANVRNVRLAFTESDVNFDDSELDLSDLLALAREAKAALDRIPNDLPSNPQDPIVTRPALLTSENAKLLAKAHKDIDDAITALKARSRE